MRQLPILPALAVALAAPLRAQCPDGSPPPCRIVAAAPARPAAGSIAVLPFANRSPDSADAYLAEALPEQIIGRLQRVRQLQVKSATAVNAQWRRTPDPMAASRALRVEWFVTGSIRRVGRNLAVSAELVRSSSGDGAWSAPFRRGDDDLAGVEEEIAESVAVAIVGRLAPEQAAALRRTTVRNPEAYRLYLFGRTLVSRRVVGDLARAVDAFAEAVRLDPQFAGGWARLSNARALQAQWGGAGALSGDSLLELAADAAARALRLDSNLAEGWMAAGQVSFNRRDLGLARTQLEQSLRLDSLSADAWHTMGYLYSVDLLNVAPLARRYYRQAISLDPDLRNSWRHLALAERDDGQLALAESLLDTALARGPWGPGYTERSWVRFLRGNPEGALADLAAAEQTGSTVASIIVAPGSPSADVLRAAYRAALGDSAAAVVLAPRLTGPETIPHRVILAMALRRRGEALALLELLRSSPDPRGEPRCGPGPCSASLRTWAALRDPLFTPLRDDPRFQRLLAETRPRIPWLANGP